MTPPGGKNIWVKKTFVWQHLANERSFFYSWWCDKKCLIVILVPPRLLNLSKCWENSIKFRQIEWYSSLLTAIQPKIDPQEVNCLLLPK